MGRRKIEIAYLNDDRVRKVTFCKRKGGLFKKADDLAKLCGVEVAVVICGESKTHEFASTSVDRILRRYGEMQAGTSDPTVDDNNKLWEQLETQRRQVESLTRQLTEERRKVEALVGSSMTAMGQQMMTVRPIQVAPAPMAFAAVPNSLAPVMVDTNPLPAAAVSAFTQLNQISNPPPPPPGVVPDDDQSQDTADIGESSGGSKPESPCVEMERVEELNVEPAAKRMRMAAEDVNVPAGHTLVPVSFDGPPAHVTA